MTENILEMRKVTKYFPGVMALEDVDFSLSKGEIHALIGENGAGKSTLMKCLLGIYKMDRGEIIFKNEKIDIRDPHTALTAGISMIHQEISLVPDMTVDENIWIGREKEMSHFGYINTADRIKKTKELLDDLGINVKPTERVKRLSVAYMQLVEIARAISYNSDIIIMDEPTSALASSEIDILFSIMRKLKERGVSIIFISHKIDEIFAICDRVTILRDAHLITTENVSDMNHDKLIKFIVGRELTNLFPKEEPNIGDIAFEVKDFNSTGVFADINFHVRKGETIGFCGLLGAGRSEVMRAVFGTDVKTSGKTILEGKEININTPSDSINHGIGMLTEDRLRQGAIHSLSVRINVTISNLKKYIRGKIYLDKKLENEDADRMIKELDVKVNNPSLPISTLSGGNQQKALIGRVLLPNPKVLILDEPTRGIDVGSKTEIHKLISQLAGKGMAIILVSSELPEIIGMCDRAYVMCNGRIKAEFSRKDFNQERMMKAAFPTT